MKGYYQESKKTIHRNREHICKNQIWQGCHIQNIKKTFTNQQKDWVGPNWKMDAMVWIASSPKINVEVLIPVLQSGLFGNRVVAGS